MAANIKIFNDPVHGSIELPPLLVKLVDTPQFQRLRNIRQLGGGYHVYPGASHNRFEHSIGTAHLAGLLICEIRSKQPELNITDTDVMCIQIAGLCHDIGHGPFSHMFDMGFIGECYKSDKWKSAVTVDGRKWTHEDGSKMMVDYLWQRFSTELLSHGLNDDHRDFVKELIIPPPYNASTKVWPFKYIKGDSKEGRRKSFMYEILSNSRNHIDVDKFDYFARDCLYLGMRNTFDHTRYIKMARVMQCDGQWQICMRKKEASNIYDMFHTRDTLHRRAYQHSVNKGIEMMIKDALILANDHIRREGSDGKGKTLVEAIWDPIAYTKYHDSIYYTLLESTEKELEAAQRIVQRIESRDLYKLIGESYPCQGDTKVDQLLTELNDTFKNLGIPSILFEFQKAQFSYGSKSLNPVEHMRFYEKNEDMPFKLEEWQVSTMLPKNYEEIYIRAYYKGNLSNAKEAHYFTKAKEIFRVIIKR